MNHLVIRY